MGLWLVQTLEERSGELLFICNPTRQESHGFFRATAIADKLGIEFALIHRQGKSDDAPERMHILVGDVKDKVIIPRTSFQRILLIVARTSC